MTHSRMAFDKKICLLKAFPSSMLILPLMMSSDPESSFENVHQTNAKALAFKRRLYKNENLQRIIRNSLPRFDRLGLLDPMWAMQGHQGETTIRRHKSWLTPRFVYLSHKSILEELRLSIINNCIIRGGNTVARAPHRFIAGENKAMVLVGIMQFFSIPEGAGEVVWADLMTFSLFFPSALPCDRNLFSSLRCCSFFSSLAFTLVE